MYMYTISHPSLQPVAPRTHAHGTTQDYEGRAEAAEESKSVAAGSISRTESNASSHNVSRSNSNVSVGYGVDGVAATLPATMKQALKEAQRDASIGVTFGDKLTGAFKMVYVESLALSPLSTHCPCRLASAA